MSMKTTVPFLAGIAGLLMKDKVYVPNIKTHKIERKSEVHQLSKRQVQKKKGKKTRKNRGRNRKPQDTALYAALRR